MQPVVVSPLGLTIPSLLMMGGRHRLILVGIIPRIRQPQPVGLMPDQLFRIPFLVRPLFIIGMDWRLIL